MKNLFLFIGIITVVLLSVPLASAVAPSDLNLFIVNTPSILNKSLDFNISWSGSDANVLNWQFAGDGNTIVDLNTAVTTTSVVDTWTGSNGDPWSAATWTQSVDSGTNTEDIQSNTGRLVAAKAGGVDGAVQMTEDATTTLGVGESIEYEVRIGAVSESGPAGESTRRFCISSAALSCQGNRGVAGFEFGDASGQPSLRVVGDVYDTTNVANSNARIKFERVSAGNVEVSMWVDDVIKVDKADTNALASYVFKAEFYAGTVNTTDGYSQQFVIDDLNKTVAGATVGSASSPRTQSHTFTTAGAKTVEVTVSNTDGNASTSLDFNIAGSLSLQVWDENAATPIPNVSIDFNSGTYTTNSAGKITIPLDNIVSGEKTIAIDINSLYQAKNFVYDINKFSVLDLNLVILKTADGTSRNYKLYQPDETTAITSSIVEWKRDTGVSNGVSQRTKTSSTGTITFFGQQDADYSLKIVDTVSNVLRLYTGTFLTVKKPLDAGDEVTLLSPFNLDVGGLATQSFTGLTADYNFLIFSDTVDYYSFAVDYNSDYYSTSKLIQTKGGDSQEDFQSYLVKKTGNIEATIFTINNPEGRITVSGIRIEAYTTVGSTSTLIESKISDGTGQGIFHFVTGQEYTLKFYSSTGTLLMTKTIEANDTSYFAYLELSSISTTITPFLTVGVQWHPTIGNVIPSADNNVSFWQLLTPENGTIGDVNLWITSVTDTNIVYNRVFTVDSSSDYNLSYDFNVFGYNSNNPLKIHLQIFDSSGTQQGAVRTKSYSFKDTGFTLATERAKDALGQFGVTLLSLILTVALIGFITSRAIGEDSNMIVIPTMFVTGAFFFIGWITFDIWASGVMFGIGVALWSVKK